MCGDPYLTNGTPILEFSLTGPTLFESSRSISSKPVRPPLGYNLTKGRVLRPHWTSFPMSRLDPDSFRVDQPVNDTNISNKSSV